MEFRILDKQLIKHVYIKATLSSTILVSNYKTEVVKLSCQLHYNLPGSYQISRFTNSKLNRDTLWLPATLLHQFLLFARCSAT